MDKIIAFPQKNGIGFCYSGNIAFAGLNKYGNTLIWSDRISDKIRIKNIPFLRMFYFMYLNIKCMLINLAKKKDFEEEKSGLSGKISDTLNVTTTQILIFSVTIISVILGIFLLGFLPVRIAFLLTDLNYDMFSKKLIVSVIKILLVYLIFLILKFVPTFRQFYRINASANILINKNKGRNSKWEPLNFLNFILFSLLFSITTISLIGFKINFFLDLLLNLLVTLLCFMLSYEILNVLSSSKNKWIYKLCLITEFLFIEKPSNTEIMLAEVAYSEVMQMNNKGRELIGELDIETGEISFSVMLCDIKQKFKSAGIDEPSDIDWIIAEVLNKSRTEIKLLNKLERDKYKKIMLAVERRIKGEPVSKIFGKTNFYGLDFKVNKNVLSPRMETEILVEEAIKLCNKKFNVLDIGTGSGVIAICISKFTGARVTSVDISSEAIKVAQENASANHAEVIFKKSDIFEAFKVKKQFDMIVSNPPYIKTEDIGTLDKEVKDYDPTIALDGGESGFDFYEKIISEAPKFLKKNGVILFEIGINQAKYIKKLLQTSFKDIKILKDYNKIERVIIGTLIK